MLFTLKEMVRWMRMTGFELWLHMISVFIFSIIAVLKYEDIITQSWWIMFIPLFACDGLNAYFCVIVFIRMCHEGDRRIGALRLLNSIMSIMLLTVFKYLLCRKLNDQESLAPSEVMAPLFILLQIVMIRACKLH
ncbi:hypothetical protein LOTGIDRAFT_190269 [Lottia gigantea]|uniref:Transmembrane protein 203 n=1 Tax=Lottia gigantea TaxID=225164 RepID=V4BUK3_LOTGI|nr:hypothetical protein LOTGIDRAFT_190269 [Lottia gigantea]ESO92769.1 hypothetical protein LOTGIDRAFT_190269 [Lottia gigantea]